MILYEGESESGGGVDLVYAQPFARNVFDTKR